MTSRAVWSGSTLRPFRRAAIRASCSVRSTVGSLAQDLSHSVRAAVHYYAGRPEQALAELELARNATWYGQTMASPLYARVAERFLRAEVLFDLGRFDEAEDWFETVGEISPTEYPYRSIAFLRLAEIAERRGDMEEASVRRAAFDALWADADPDLRAQVSG
jgi:tetratricopeptide (TPR) repeat protein